MTLDDLKEDHLRPYLYTDGDSGAVDLSRCMFRRISDTEYLNFQRFQCHSRPSRIIAGYGLCEWHISKLKRDLNIKEEMEPFTLMMERLEDGSIYLSCGELELSGSGQTFSEAAADFFSCAVELKKELTNANMDEFDKRWIRVRDRLIEFLRIDLLRPGNGRSNSGSKTVSKGRV